MSADEIIASLQQAKGKLAKAKGDGLKAVSIVAQARDSVTHALGRASVNSRLVAEMTAKQKALLAKVMSIDALVTRIDTAIQQAQSIGDAGGGAPA